MLQRLVLLNSRVYGRAELKFDDCDSIQLVGPNNVGKSTLIYALNFLFVIDGNKMSFSGNRPGDKETIHHYFPTPNSSYIVFEIGKNKQYCILVKRNTEGELEYFYIGAAYDEEIFFERDDVNSYKLLKFEEVSKRINAENIEFFQFKNKSEVFSHVYHRGTDNNSVVWLEDNVKTDGLSNSFSKVYRYLINSKLITNKTLKDSLIIADNRENETINFSQKNKKDITDLMRINNDIRSVKSIQAEFREFREVVNMYNAKSKILAQLVYAFNHNYDTAFNNLEKRFNDKTKEISLVQNELNEILEPRKQELNRNIGKKESEVLLKDQELSRYEVQLEEIATFETEKFLNEALLNLEKERKETESRITRIENQKLSKQQVAQQLERINHNLERLQTQIANYNEQFIHNVTDKHDHKKLLNYIFSEDFTANPEIKIKSKVSKAGKDLHVFDGILELPKSLPLKELPSTEELQQEIERCKAEKAEYEKLLPIAEDFEKTKEELNVLHAKLEEIREKLHKLKNKPSLDKIAGELKKYIHSVKTDKDQLERDLKLLNGEIAAKSGALQVSQDERKQLEYRRNQLRERKIEVEMIGTEPSEYDTNDSLDIIYTKLRNMVHECEQLKINKDKTFDHLRYKINSNVADVEEFVKYVEDEIACVEDKQKSIDGLLQSISTQFAYPAHNLFRRYQEFKEFVNNKFNQKLSEIKISDIESLEIKLIDNARVLGELKKISSIEDFKGQLTLDFDQTENLKVLNNFLDSGKKIHFNELFDIELSLKIKGIEKTVDLKDQVESDGTDRMIRLVIVMSIINRLAVDRKENKIVLFIDEVGTIDEHNRPELVRFCKEHSFIPIFAAPQPFDGFDKYYMLFRTQGKVNVNEKHHALRRLELVR